MRTLKKTLCLVLAIVMVAGLCMISTNAAFDDDAEIIYKEAVGVLAGVKVIDGVGDNKFDPKGTLTRAQAAKIATYLLDMADVTGAAPFTDVPAGMWYTAPIAFCAAEGIVNGVGDNKFDPQGTLTGSAWAKMVLVCLGYDADAEGMTGASWEVGVAKLVKKLDLAKGIEKFDGTKGITREEACQIAYNALTIPMVEYSTSGITVKTGDVEITTGASPAYPSGDYLGEDLGVVDAYGDFKTVSKVDDEGNEYYYYYTKDAKTPITDKFYTDKSVGTFAAGKSAKDVCKALDITANSTEKGQYYVNGIANGPQFNVKDYVADTTKVPAGVSVEVLKDAAGNYKIMATVTYVVKAGAGTKVTDKTDEHYGEYKFVLGSYASAPVYGADAKAYTGYYAVVPQGDSVAAEKFLACEKVEAVEAKATKYTLTTASKLATVTVNGTAYPVAAVGSAAALAEVPFTTAKAYYIYDGCLYVVDDAATPEVAAVDGYAYVLKLQSSYKGGSEADLFADAKAAEVAVKAQIVTTDGETKIVDLAVTAETAGGVTKYYAKDLDGTKVEITASTSTAPNKWVAFYEDAGVYTFTNLPTEAGVVTLSADYAKKTATLEGCYMGSATVYKVFNLKDKTTKAVTGYENIEIKTGAKVLIVANSKNVVQAVYEIRTASDIPTTTSYAYAATKGATVAEGVEWTFYVDGKAETKVVKLAPDAEWTVSALTKGKVYELKTDEKGIVVGAKGETEVPAGKVITLVESTYVAFAGGTYNLGTGYKVFNITTGTPGEADVIEVGDTVAEVVAGKLFYIVDAAE